jgi:hypothetical protein
MSKEIRAKIDELNNQLERVVVPGTFILNPEAVRITKEIAALQSQCQHHFVEGQCEFCHLEGTNE